MKKIKKCPHCGAYAKLRRIGQGYAVKCTECGATGRKEYPQDWHPSPCTAQSAAIEAWNARVKT